MGKIQDSKHARYALDFGRKYAQFMKLQYKPAFRIKHVFPNAVPSKNNSLVQYLLSNLDPIIFAISELLIYLFRMGMVKRCRFRDLKAEYDALNCVVLAVSADDEASHIKFIEKLGLNFSLLADTNK